MAGAREAEISAAERYGMGEKSGGGEVKENYWDGATVVSTRSNFN